MKVRLIPLWRGAFAALAVLALGGCERAATAGWSGYAEGDYIYVAAPVAGRLQRLEVQAGDQVQAGAPLFALEGQPERDAASAAQAQLAAAQAQAANLQTGRRPDEIAQIEAQLAQARAQAELSAADLARKLALTGPAAVSRLEADAARSAAEQSRQRVAELQAALRTARQPAREQERSAARAQADSAASALAQQRWRLDETAQRAPADAQVTDTFYRVGEWVAAGQPVLALLPPQQRKARFFVPEPEVGALALGAALLLSCDGCGTPIAARVTRIATQAEYTPPVIYSNTQRAKLVFMAEARPVNAADAVRLKPGQPLDVKRDGGADDDRARQ
ncbi:MAG: HlyD family efflux transporter periplasmic adaptor subunit [Burkholderiaceae bacterium]|jgi:HlyD family secretion protein|nr:HlyD family efflux transporter periplasmic adaptor subunit [Burkholderiaceae bacterium]